MFSKAKKEADNQSGLVEIGDAPEPQQPAPKKDVRTNRLSSGSPRKSSANKAPAVPSLISSDVVIKGSMTADGEVQFDGTIDGNITAKGLVIGEGALVSGEVNADHVKVSGTVEGTIRANRVDLAATAVVKGDIVHTALSIENGARFEGTCAHSESPHSEDSTPPKPMAPKPAARPTGVVSQAQDAPEPRVEPAAEAAPAIQAEPAHEEARLTANSDLAVESRQKSPALKSVPGNAGAPTTAFLNRGNKTDLR